MKWFEFFYGGVWAGPTVIREGNVILAIETMEDQQIESRISSCLERPAKTKKGKGVGVGRNKNKGMKNLWEKLTKRGRERHIWGLTE